jgi:hypothetical protein
VTLKQNQICVLFPEKAKDAGEENPNATNEKAPAT